MQKIVLGKTGLEVNKNGFGALPVQRVTKKEAVYLLQKAFYHGINYFDTARMYTDSEEKMGAAFAHIRERIVISTKTGAEDAEGFWKDLEESLRNLQTDYIDIYQFHNPSFCRLFRMDLFWRPVLVPFSSLKPICFFSSSFAITY